MREGGRKRLGGILIQFHDTLYATCCRYLLQCLMLEVTAIKTGIIKRIKHETLQVWSVGMKIGTEKEQKDTKERD